MLPIPVHPDPSFPALGCADNHHKKENKKKHKSKNKDKVKIVNKNMDKTRHNKENNQNKNTRRAIPVFTFGPGSEPGAPNFRAGAEF